MRLGAKCFIIKPSHLDEFLTDVAHPRPAAGREMSPLAAISTAIGAAKTFELSRTLRTPAHDEIGSYTSTCETQEDVPTGQQTKSDRVSGGTRCYSQVSMRD